MTPLQISHIYGSVVIQSAICPKCGDRAFIIQGDMSCCGGPPPTDGTGGFKIELDKTRSGRKSPPFKDRKRILQEQDGLCFYCGDSFGTVRVMDGKAKFVLLNWDHVVPHSWDGNNNEFVAACRECNSAKHNLHFPTMEEAKTYLQMKIHEKKTTTRAETV